MKIGVLGAGTWGMALARMLANDDKEVMVWSAIEKEIDDMSATRTHKNLPGMVIPESIVFTKKIEDVCKDKDILLFAVPSVYVREKRCTIYRRRTDHRRCGQGHRTWHFIHDVTGHRR